MQPEGNNEAKTAVLVFKGGEGNYNETTTAVPVCEEGEVTIIKARVELCHPVNTHPLASGPLQAFYNSLHLAFRCRTCIGGTGRGPQ